MKIYDIAQEVFGCQVFAGDPAPEKKQLCSIEKGDLYNLTALVCVLTTARISTRRSTLSKAEKPLIP